MIFSALVTLLLLGLIVYALLQQREFPLIGRLLPVLALLGIYVVWFPNSTSQAAHWIGIGRGSDLMLYVWSLVSGLLILGLHLKLVAYERRITELARYVAIADARAPQARDGELAARGS
jgi:small membrane protein